VRTADPTLFAETIDIDDNWRYDLDE
jgi:hypothetical protein